MKKSQKIITAILAVVLVISAAFAVITSNDKITGVLFGGVKPVSEKKLSDVEMLSFKSDYPLVQMQDNKFFYEPFPDGTFKFYKFNGESFDEVTDVKTRSVTLEVSYQPVKIKIYYIKTDSGMAGYGLFNSEQGSDVKMLSYVFVRMMKCPEPFKSAAKSDYILLADLTASDAYKTNKSYSDMYSFNIDTGKTALVVNQRDRTVQENGITNEGWTIFTDSSLNLQKKTDLFASTRVNDNKAESKQYCLMTIANASETIKKKVESATVFDCVSCEFREKGDDYFCLAKTSDGFDLIKNKDKKNPVKSFSGEISDYFISGNWILNRATYEITDFCTGESKELKQVTSAAIYGLVATDDGTKFVVFTNGEKNQSMVVYDTSNGTVEAVSDKIFNSGICNFCFADESHVMVSDYDDSGATVNNIIKV